MAYNVLIVDDSKVVRSVIEKTLRMTGLDLAEVHQAGNGEEALEQLKDAWVDVIFTDINMPVMNGMDFVKQLKDDGVIGSTPVVVVSTEGSETRIEQLKSWGVSGYIRKPFQPEIVRDLLNEILHPEAA